MELSLAILILIVVGLVLGIVYRKKKRREEFERHRAALLAKYQDAHIVDMIIKHMFWQGQTQEQLIDSLGQPADIDQKVLKTKVKEVWKYKQTGANRFGLRVTLEDKVVIGWDHKE
jgi:hypothetical protein